MFDAAFELDALNGRRVLTWGEDFKAAMAVAVTLGRVPIFPNWLDNVIYLGRSELWHVYAIVTISE